MKFLLRVFASAVARRLAFVLVALLLAWCGVGKAQAQTGGDTCEPQPNAFIGFQCQYKHHAYQRAAAGIDKNGSNAASFCAARAGIGSGSTFQNAPPVLNGSGQWDSIVKCYNAAGTLWGTYARYYASFVAQCPIGTTWQEATKTCFSAEQCLAKPSLGAGVAKGGGFATCSEGCEFKSAGAQMEFTFGDGTKMTPATTWQPTGQPCAANAPPPPDTTKAQECTPLGGGQTACLKPDGQHCYSASTGRQICWKPGETGEKADGPVLQKVNAGNQPIAPNLQLPNGDTLQQSTTPTTTTINNTTNNTTTTTTTTGYVTQNGTNADGSTGGSGEPGDGTGSGDGEGDGPGGVGDGAGAGDFYEGSDKTLESVFAQYKTRIQAAPIAQAATDFITVSLSGPCPVWSVPATDWWPVMTFTWHCSGPLAEALALGGWLILAVAAWTAFKWGFH